MKTTKEMIEVMQSFDDGKEIECNNGYGWIPMSDPIWNWIGNDYRIKPKAKVKRWLWASFDEQSREWGQGNIFYTEEEVSHWGIKVIKIESSMIEVDE